MGSNASKGHLHTNYSADAFGLGNLTVSPQEAYRLARGERVTATGGSPVQLGRPLDFLVVADHAEYVGVFPMLAKGAPADGKWEQGRRWSDWIRAGNVKAAMEEFFGLFAFGRGGRQRAARAGEIALAGRRYNRRPVQ